VPVDTALYAICALAGFVSFGYAVRLYRRRPSVTRRAVCVAFGAFAVGITFAVPPVAALVDHAAGLPNLAKVLAHGAVMAIAANAEVMLLYLALPVERARRRMWGGLAFSAVAYTLMLALGASVATRDPVVLLTVEYATVPAVTGYLAIYLLRTVWYSVDIARLCWRFAALCGRPWLRRGLRLTAAGSVFALMYCAEKLGYLVAYWSGRHPGGEREVAAVLIAAGGLLMLCGLTMPAWGPDLQSAARWLGRLRSYRALGPLWLAISAARPHLVLDQALGSDRPPVADRSSWRRLAGRLRRAARVARDVDYALTRRVVEIRDGRFALQPYLDQRVAEAAARSAADAGLTGPAALAVVEAAQIAAAIRALDRDARAAVVDRRQPYNPLGGYDGEVAWLVRVTRAYAGSPVVARAVRSVAEVAADPR
jgi:hypothetical protein